MIMEAYYDMKAPSSYGGIDALYRLMKQRGANAMRKQLVNWLAEQKTYDYYERYEGYFTL